MTEQRKTGAQQVQRSVWQDGAVEQGEDWVAEEVAVALMYNCISHVVMMTTPRDLDDFAIGFSLSEGIVEHASDILDIEISDDESGNGIVIAMLIPEVDFEKLKDQRRNMTGRTGCGLCGAETLEQAIKPPRKVRGELSISASSIQKAIAAFSDQQVLMAKTGGVHGAAWCDANGVIRLMREDVGRHNALDKLIGAMALAKIGEQGFVLVTSRASYEMVSKVAMANIKLMVAVSAPSSLAIKMAEESGVSLIAFGRNKRHSVYTRFHHLIS